MASSVKPSPATKREEGLREWNGRRCPLSLCCLKWGDNSNDDYRHGLLYYSCSVDRPRRFSLTRRSYLRRGRILGRIPDKSRKSFPPCYSQSPLQLCLEIFYFFKLTQPLSYFFKLTQPLTYFFKLMQPLMYFTV